MTKVAVIFHSGYGHTAKVAEHVVKGAESVADTEVKLIPVSEWILNEEYLDGVDAIIFGAPTYMGSASAPMKQFMDETSKVWYGQKWRDKIAAGFTNSGGLSGDKLSTLNQLHTFAMQHSMIWVSLGLLPDGRGDDNLNRLASYGGLMTQSDTTSGADVAPPSGDLKTAEHFGRRVAEVTKRWAANKVG